MTNACTRCGEHAATRRSGTGHPICESCALEHALDKVEEFLARFVVFTNDHQRVACTLWVAVTWAIDAFDVAPYLLATAPVRQAGKTRLLEVLHMLAARPMMASNISPAALYRVVDAEHPTLLLDEIDAIYGAKASGNEDLRALINAGHRRGAVAIRMAGPKGDRAVTFDPFCPKALAGIDETGTSVPDTIRDRSIPVHLKRRSSDEPVERFRHRRADADAAPIRATLEALLDDFTVDLDDLPEPDGLSDRALDLWEPLFAVANAAGELWAERAHAAALELSGHGDARTDTLGIRLLSDIRDVFATVDGIDTDPNLKRISTTALLERLHALEESPWKDHDLNARRLAAKLHPYEVSSVTVRLPDDSTLKGYRSEDFADAWRRYVDPMVTASVTSSVTSAPTLDLDPST